MCGHCLVLNRDGGNNDFDNQATYDFASVFLGHQLFQVDTFT